LLGRAALLPRKEGSGEGMGGTGGGPLCDAANAEKFTASVEAMHSPPGSHSTLMFACLTTCDQR
jgi:hypothetical protein